MEIDKVAIVGAGPAGVATAIQLRRYGISPLLFEKDEVGGLLSNANLVENYPGFPGGIPGPQLVKRIAHQLVDASVEVIPEVVINMDIDGETFLIETPRQRFYSLYSVVASGTKPRKPASPEIPAEIQPYIYYEVAPLSHVKGKKIVIVGAGDAAFDYAINLSRTNEVVILNRGTAVKCTPLLWKRAQAVPTIVYHPEVVIVRVCMASVDEPGNLVCECSEDGLMFRADFVIFAIGRDPQLDFLAEGVRQHQDKLIADGKFYLVGDVKNKLYRQTAIAVGDGILAAMKISRSLGR